MSFDFDAAKLSICASSSARSFMLRRPLPRGRSPGGGPTPSSITRSVTPPSVRSWSYTQPVRYTGTISTSSGWTRVQWRHSW